MKISREGWYGIMVIQQWIVIIFLILWLEVVKDGLHI
jgi:hypothetical protein